MKEYNFSHRIGKLLMMMSVLVLLYFDGSLTVFNGLAIAVWVWGTNIFSYMVETLKGWRHRHGKL